MVTTINDVARIAGVSASTVSRVLSDSPRISKETKQKVLKIVRELNYYPNAVARSLANSSTRTVGLILNAEEDTLIRNTFYIQSLVGVSSHARKRGYNVMFSYNKYEEEELNIAFRYVSERSVDGIILFTSRFNDKCIDFLKNKGFPFSVIGRPDETSGVLWVDNDNFQATYQVTDHLISRGHNLIAFIGGPSGYNVSKDRLEGFKKAMTIHGISPDESMIFNDGDFSDSFGYACMMKIISGSESGQNKPTAVVTCDDMQAMGVLRAMQEKGITDIAVTGFNNSPLGIYQTPKLTSVDVNAEKLGFYASKVLLDNIEGKENAPAHYIVPTDLIIRESAF